VIDTQTTIDRIDELFEPHTSEPGPGANVAVVRNGEVELVRSYGLASIEHAVPVTRDTVFYIASTSKQFVAASIAMLEADEKLSLDDDIRTWLPELHEFEPPILVHHLLHHTSGIRDKYTLAAVGALPEDSYSTDRGSLELISAQRTLGFPTGTRMDYTNSGYFLLAQIVERISGSTFPDFTRERIFGPLGMENTSFRADTNVVIPHRASGYTKGADGAWRLAEYTLSSLGPGGVVTTVDDLARWDRSFTSGELVPPDLHTRMLRTRALADGSPNTYALGLMTGEWRGLAVVHHGGGVAGFTAEFLRFPTEGVTVICLANSPFVAASMKARQVAEIVLGDRLAPVPNSEADGDGASGANLDGWQGTYVADGDILLARIVATDDGHVLEVAGQRIPLAARGKDVAHAGPLVIERRDDGSFEATQGDVRIGRFTRLAETPPPDDADICGTYRSDELDCTAVVKRNAAGELVFERQRAGPDPLEHRGGDVFRTTGSAMSSSLSLIVRLIRDDGSRVTGLSVSAGRGPNNIFQRVAP
jgi:CubicO group peptidase (beta-lactamase class C family)